LAYSGMCGYRLWVIDLDGVVWRGSMAIRDNVEAIREIISSGGLTVFLTNNSTRHRRVYAEKLSRILGLHVDYRDVYTSGYSAAKWLSARIGRARVYSIGEEGLAWELVEEGHILVGSDFVENCSVDAVVAGLDRFFSYQKLRLAHRAIVRCNAVFVATNTDRTLPVEDGEDPGAAAIIEAISSSTGRKPDFIAGKPNPWILSLILEDKRVDRSSVIVVGDRFETDIRLAVESGVTSLLIANTSTERDVEIRTGILVAKSLKEFIRRCSS